MKSIKTELIYSLMLYFMPVSSLTTLDSTLPKNQFTFHEFSIDTDNFELTHQSGHTFRLRPKEFSLLLFMINNRNKIVNKSALLELLWNYDIYTPTNTLEVHMSCLRKKLQLFTPQMLIQTIHGAGYRLIV